MEGASKQKDKYIHVDLASVEKYARNKTYPSSIISRGEKANFRRQCRNFNIVDGQLMYKEKRLVITSKERQQCIIHDVHEGLGSVPKARAMAAHRGRETTYQKIAERFFWYNIVNDVLDYIKKCDTCQKHKAMPKVTSQDLHSIPVPSCT